MTYSIAVLGATVGTMPSHPRIQWCDPGDECDAALVAGKISDEDWNLHTRRLSTLAPIAAVSGANVAADITFDRLDMSQLEALVSAFDRIQKRRAELNEYAWTAEDGRELSVLALAYTRDTSLRVRRSGSFKSTALYGLLEGRPGLDGLDFRGLSEGLARADLLSRSFACRVLTCPSCQSGRLSGYEACAGCGSAHLAEESLIHHYRCGQNDVESCFVKGNELVCPKCRRELRHFGVDYGRPGTTLRCEACDCSTSEPLPRFCCLDCQADFKGVQATTVDWFNYNLTDQGISALKAGQLPRQDFRTILKSLPRTYSDKEFALVVREQVMVARRYDRPFTLGRIAVADSETVRGLIGSAAHSQALQLFTGIIVENLRATDFVSAQQGDLLSIAMPETNPAEAEAVLARIADKAKSALAQPLTINVAAYAADQVEHVL